MIPFDPTLHLSLIIHRQSHCAGSEPVATTGGANTESNNLVSVLTGAHPSQGNPPKPKPFTLNKILTYLNL